MAIPLSNDLREVRGPQTANLKPLDEGAMLQRMGENALQMNRQMQDAIRGGMNFGQKIMDQQDAFKRNEAERVYNERTTELNIELAQKQGEERVKFQPKYEAEMKKASDVYEASINRVSNFEIREGSKRSINAWNNRNASNYQYDNYKNYTYLQARSMAQALISDNDKRVTSITSADTAQSLARYAADPNLGFSHGEQLIRDFYGNRMGLPSEVVDQYVKDYKTKGYMAMANRLVQVTKEYTGNAAYTPAVQFLKDAVNRGEISPKEGIDAQRQLENERLILNVAHNPRWFIGDDGKFNPKGRGRFAPDLTQYEYERIIKLAEEGVKKGKTPAAIQAEAVFQDRYRKDALNFRLNTGLVNKKDLQMLTKVLGLKEDKEGVNKKISTLFQDKAKALKPTQLIDRLSGLEKVYNTAVIVDTDGNIINDDPTAKESEEASKNPQLQIVYPYHGNKEMESDLKNYSDMLTFMYFGYSGDNLLPSFRDGNRPPVKDIAYDIAYRVASQYQKATGGELSYVELGEWVQNTVNALGNGWYKPTGDIADGKPVNRRIRLDPNKSIGDKDLLAQQMIIDTLKQTSLTTFDPTVLESMGGLEMAAKEAMHPLYNPTNDWDGRRPGGLGTAAGAALLPGVFAIQGTDAIKHGKQAFNDLVEFFSPKDDGVTLQDQKAYEEYSMENGNSILGAISVQSIIRDNKMVDKEENK